MLVAAVRVGHEYTPDLIVVANEQYETSRAAAETQAKTHLRGLEHSRVVHGLVTVRRDS